MSTSGLVKAFYDRIWNAGDTAAAEELLTVDFCFRGSLGPEMRGRDPFCDYVRAVRAALQGYRCDILDCVTEGPKAFAKMRFSGIHVGPFRGFPSRASRWNGLAPPSSEPKNRASQNFGCSEISFRWIQSSRAMRGDSPAWSDTQSLAVYRPPVWSHGEFESMSRPSLPGGVVQSCRRISRPPSSRRRRRSPPGRTSRRSRAMHGSAGRLPARSRKPGPATFSALRKT